MIGKIQDVMTAAVVISAADNAAAKSGSTSAAVSTSVLPTDAAAATDTTTAVQGNKEQDAAAKKKSEDAQNDQKMDEKSVNNMTKELNKLMSQINCNLEFQYHKEVNVMSVKMIDKDTKEVLKEYPPEDMIKGMIAAKEWIGAFLDKTV